MQLGNMLKEESNVDSKYVIHEEIEGQHSSGTDERRDSKQSQKPENKTTERKKLAYYKLFTYADSVDYALMFVGTISAIGNGFCPPLMAMLLGELADSFGKSNTTTKQEVNQVSKVCLKYVYLAVGNGLAAFFQVACWAITGERQAARIRSFYLRSILRQEIGFFDKQMNSREIIAGMSGDTFLVQDAIGEKVGKFVQLTASFLGGFVIAFTKGWLLTLVLISSIPPIVISASVMFYLLTKLTSQGQSAYSVAGTVVDQTLTSIKTVVSFTGENQAIDKFEKSLNKAYKSGVQSGLAVGLCTGAFMFVVYSSYALALWYGARMIIQEEYSGGEVLNVIAATLSGSYALGQASPCLGAFSSGQNAASNMFETIKRKSKIDPYNNKKAISLDDIHGDIEFKDVCFSYPSRLDELVLRGFSLAIPRGTIAALVGRSGSGKSTVINLIERFYDPQSGEVLIDDINVKNFQLGWIRGKIGLVSQEPILFASSIKDNVSYGKDGATLEEIKASVELANAAEFVDKLPQGLETMVGEHGTQLSGGQKQKIAIARAILKKPRILLLDEATSALDAESERIVQQALDRVMINCTTIVVAHRLGTVKNADMIVVIHQGKIIENGTHNELVEDPEGAYSKLIRLQQLSKESKQKKEHDPDLGISSHVNPRQHISKIISSSSQKSFENGNSSFRSSFSVPLTIAKHNIELATSKGISKAVSLWRLARLNKPEIVILLVGSIAAAIHGLVQPLFGLLFASMIKIFYEPAHELRKDSKFWALMFLGLGAVTLLTTTIRSFCFSVAGCRLIKRIRIMCFKKVVHMDISWFEQAENTSGAIGARLSIDATLLRSLVGDTLALIVQNVATIIAGLAIAFQANWLLALIILVIVPLLGFGGYLPMKYIGGFSTDAKILHEEASQVASDAVGSIRTVASFCAEEKVMWLYEKKCEGPIKAGIKHGLIGGVALGSSLFLMFLVYAASFYSGARLVEAGKMDFSQVFRVFFVLCMSTMGVTSLMGIYPDSSKAKLAAASIFEILDSKSKVNSYDDSGRILKCVKGDVELRLVTFKYPARPDVQVFKDLSLTIPSGKVVALVGESGSGKSTVISLLLRFYDPDSGLISLDGVEIQSLKLKWLRQQIGVVSQEPVLFNDTIRANISYGKAGNTTEAEIIVAAELGNAHNFITSLPQGYDTIVGDRGIQLSGGQRQRVAIARAIMKSPKILLLDEATSALDAESEKVVQDALDQVMVDRTTLVVAHRLSTIRNADLIAVMKNGEVAEKGSHKDLFEIKDGIYASLVALQTSALP